MFSAGAHLAGEEGKGERRKSKIEKSALILEKKCPDCVHPCIKFLI